MFTSSLNMLRVKYPTQKRNCIYTQIRLNHTDQIETFISSATQTISVFLAKIAHAEETDYSNTAWRIKKNHTEDTTETRSWGEKCVQES